MAGFRQLGPRPWGGVRLRKVGFGLGFRLSISVGCGLDLHAQWRPRSTLASKSAFAGARHLGIWHERRLGVVTAVT